MKTVHALNTVSGKVSVIPATFLDHPVFGKTLVEVPEGTKSYDPEFYKPTDAEGHALKATTKRKNKTEEEVTPDPQPALDLDIQ